MAPEESAKGVRLPAQCAVRSEDWLPDATFVHEKSYSRLYLGGIVHRARLRAITRTLRRYVTRDVSSWADFGCSNGYVIARVLAGGDFNFRRIVGYDHSHALLQMADARKLDNVVFSYRDMNAAPPPRSVNQETHELVTCFETLEHVADYRWSISSCPSHRWCR